jgi:CheY-like chemotaxis protein
MLEILVVDDIKENRETAKQYFESVGFKVDLGVDYETGKERIEEKDYYFAILDLQMPNKEGNFGDFGFELEKLAFDKYKIPTLVLTGRMANNHHRPGSSILLNGNTINSTLVKTELEAWKKTHEVMEKTWKPKYLWNSKKQVEELLGRRFQEINYKGGK